MSGPLVQAIGWALLHLLWQGVLVAAILAATLALLQRQSANARYLASCGALLLLVALGIATAYRVYEPGVEAGFSSPIGLRPSATLDLSAAADAPAAALDLVSIVNAHLAQIVAIWLAGVLILSTRLIAGWIGARRLAVRGTHAAGEQWQRSLYRIAGTLRLLRPIKLLESAAVEVPTVVGWLRPVVLLPVASLSGLSTQQIEMVLAHELAHIRRHDFIINLMQSVVETLLFYHPAVWWISRRIRVEREHCCDDLAVAVFGDPIQYARALTRFEELRMNATQSVIAANGGSLIGRIRRLVLARAESANWSSRWAAGAALLTVIAAIVLTPALPVFANHDDEQGPPAATKAAKVPEKSKGPSSCDKPTTPPPAQATVEVNADGDDDVETSDDPQLPPTPAPHPMPVVAPHIAVNIDDIVRTAIAAIAPEPPERPRRRRHIGEGGKLTVDDLIALRIAGVNSKYIEEMRSAGLGNLSLDDLAEMRMMGVTPKYIKEMADGGYSHLTARELTELRTMGVVPQFIKSLAEAGYSKLSVKELVRLKTSGVDADFIRDLAKYRSK